MKSYDTEKQYSENCDTLNATWMFSEVTSKDTPYKDPVFKVGAFILNDPEYERHLNNKDKYPSMKTNQIDSIEWYIRLIKQIRREDG